MGNISAALQGQTHGLAALGPLVSRESVAVQHSSMGFLEKHARGGVGVPDHLLLRDASLPPSPALSGCSWDLPSAILSFSSICTEPDSLAVRQGRPGGRGQPSGHREGHLGPWRFGGEGGVYCVRSQR